MIFEVLTIIHFGLGLAILYQIYKGWKMDRDHKREMKKIDDDWEALKARLSQRVMKACARRDHREQAIERSYEANR